MAAAGQRWRPVLGGRLKARCGEARGQVAHEHAWRIVAKKVTPDQVHPLVRVGKTNAPASVVRTFEGRTARVLRDEFP
jgi:putative transposase